MSLLYEGKAKKIYSVDSKPDVVLVEYKDSLTAFNALKTGSFENKGQLNRNITSLIFRYLQEQGIETHWLADEGPCSMLVKKLEIIPLEVVVRNVLAGSTAKKLGLNEGQELASPLVEFYFKNDELADPFLSDDQVLMMKIVTASEINELKRRALQINSSLQKLFIAVGIRLIDFKVEFGKTLDGGQILLADEISPDCCRLWDIQSGQKLDKDRFRRDLGQVQESYQDVCNRLEAHFKEARLLRFGVRVMPRDVILDTQGRAVEQSLERRGFKAHCRVGKYIVLEIKETGVPGTPSVQEQAHEIAKLVLCNPLIENYEIEAL